MQIFTNPNVEVRGTAAELVKKGLKINGVAVDAIGLGVLAKHGLLDIIGEGQKPARGRTAKMLAAKTGVEMKFSFGE